MLRQRLLTGSLLGALDQAVLSAFSLGIGLAFIRLGEKAEYAAYVLLFSSVQLAQVVQNALVSSPLTTLTAGRRATGDDGALMIAAKRLQRWLVAVVVAACLLGALVDGLLGTGRMPAIAALAIAAVGLLSREFVRARYFLEQRALQALLSDLAFVGVATVLIAVLIRVHMLTAALVLTAMGVAGIAGGLRAGLGAHEPPGRASVDGRMHLRDLWTCGRWALPSVVNSWLLANAFLFVVQTLVSNEAVADVSAARLLLVPLSLLMVGWASAFRPKATLLFASGRADRVHTIAKLSAAGFAAAGVFYGVALVIAMPLLQAVLLSSKYTGLGWTVAAWLVYYAIAAVRGAGMACMLASPAGFRTLYLYGCVGLAVALPAVVLASLAASVPGVVGGLALGEFVLAGLIWGRGWPALRREAETGRP